MRANRSRFLLATRLRPLAACLAVVLGVEASGAGLQASAALRDIRGSLRGGAAIPLAFASIQAGDIDRPTTTLVVRNCDDAGPDSLRDVVHAANMLGTDATIQFDLVAMACSAITLSTGEIEVTVPNMTIEGPGPNVVTISGGYSQQHYNRIFKHTGNGVLGLDNLALADAKYFAHGNEEAKGGCVYSLGTVRLQNARLDGCRVASESGVAHGGGIWGWGAELVDSVVANSSALSQLGQAGGGGIFVDALGLNADESTIDGNTATSLSSAPVANGGGVDARGPVVLQRSTISGNTAVSGGGLFGAKPVAIVNSTFSSNTALRGIAAIYVHDTLSLYNSTVAFNKANEYGRVAGASAESVYAISSILAKNMTYDGSNSVESDVQSSNGLVSGSHDLILAANAGTTLPMDTLTGCPRLAPLLDNGGSTRTLALLPGSSAIDTGYDPFSLGVDQRGAGFARVIGANADIGAYELSSGSGDAINSGGFELCD